MIYLIAIICPPLALLLKGKIFQTIFNGVFWITSVAMYVFSFGLLGVLTFPVWIATIIWGVVVVKGAKDDERHSELLDAARSRD